MNGVPMPGVSAGSNHVGASETCTPHVIWPSGAAAAGAAATRRAASATSDVRLLMTILPSDRLGAPPASADDRRSSASACSSQGGARRMLSPAGTKGNHVRLRAVASGAIVCTPSAPTGRWPMTPGPEPANLDGLVDVDRGIISREIFVNEEIYRQEQEQVFARAWLFIGHESQIPKPGDYLVSSMGE